MKVPLADEQWREEMRKDAIEKAWRALGLEVVCRVCKNGPVLDSWPWGKPEQAICSACCGISEEGHDYQHNGASGHGCVHCGAEPPPDWYDI